jgi:hypothetical protein
LPYVVVAEHEFSAFWSAHSFVTNHSDLFLSYSQGENGKELNGAENV